MIVDSTVGAIRDGQVDLLECVYCVYDVGDHAIYVGQTKNLRNRFQNHLSPSKKEKLALELRAALPVSLGWRVELWTADEFKGDLDAVESILIKARSPRLNVETESHALIVYRQEDIETAISAARPKPSINTIINLVTNAVTSQHTRRAYARALTEFMTWHSSTGQTGFAKATVQAHVSALRAAGVSASSINQRLTAIRKLAVELADNGIIDHSTAQAIGRVEGVRKEGKRLGNWLTKEQAQQLLGLPNVTTVKGLRDRAILAILLGCGLRREECAGLTVGHIQQREGRWVIVDLVGKRSKTRSVPMPSWAKYAIDSYCQAAGVTSGVLFRSTRRGDHITDQGMTAQAIFDVVKTYAQQIGVEVRPHDLRRTFAKLAHKGAAPIEQIQLSLGHSSVQTTERYIGVQQDLSSAPCDALGLKI